MLKRCLTLVGLVYTLSLFNISDAAAKICFLPDSSCGTGKISSVKPSPSQCLYSSMAQAQNGMSSCEKAYKQNFCFYRRCKTREEDKNVFSNYSDCQKALEDNQTCQSCGGCYKIVTNANQTPNNKTCNETEATCSAKGKAFEANGEYDSNNVACGSCKVNEICPSGYSTAYQSQKDCKTGETFSSNGTANGKVCGKCTPSTPECTPKDCSEYTYTTLSDYANSESCDRGCNQGKKYRCKSGYTYSNGKCVKACTYTYFEATPSNTCGTTGNLDRNESCKTSTCCFKSLSRVESIDIGSGSPSVMPIYNKINNKSDSCVRDGTTYYETLCTGTPEGRCHKTFTPNGCVSSGYNHGYEVKGTKWGTCGCDTTSGQYDTADACRKATGKGCTSVNSCYRTCESQGYFSTEKACKENLPSGYKCASPGSAGNSNCYTRYQPGFAIRYASTPKRTWNCSPNGGGASIQQRFSAWLAKVTVSNGVHQPGERVKTIDGIDYGELSDKEYRYEAGTYFVCASNGAAYSTAVVGVRKTVVQSTRSANGADPSRLVCFADTISSQYDNTECQKSTAWGAGYNCREVTFNEGVLYLVAIYGDNGYPGTTTNKYNCHNQ